MISYSSIGITASSNENCILNGFKNRNSSYITQPADLQKLKRGSIISSMEITARQLNL